MSLSCPVMKSKVRAVPEAVDYSGAGPRNPQHRSAGRQVDGVDGERGTIGAIKRIRAEDKLGAITTGITIGVRVERIRARVVDLLTIEESISVRIRIVRIGAELAFPLVGESIVIGIIRSARALHDADGAESPIDGLPVLEFDRDFHRVRSRDRVTGHIHDGAGLGKEGAPQEVLDLRCAIRGGPCSGEADRRTVEIEPLTRIVGAHRDLDVGFGRPVATDGD